MNEVTRSTSDLIDLVHHEHNHLRLLFEDLEATFSKIAAGELGDDSRQERLESAREDLAVALEEMLHHFNQEEEVFFIDLETRFPELSPDIARLVSEHEAMCVRTRWLQRQLNKRRDETMVEDAVAILDVLRALRQVVVEHTENETRIFERALAVMPAQERSQLLDDMRRL